MFAEIFALVSAGVFLLFGMLSGIWKYRHMASSPDARAPYYVDICHRAALQYSFACLVLYHLARESVWPDMVNAFATVLPIAFFASAVFTYWLHGMLQDTDNQLSRPHKLGSSTIPGVLIKGYMLALIAGEVGGVMVLLAGVISGLGQS